MKETAQKLDSFDGDCRHLARQAEEYYKKQKPWLGLVPVDIIPAQEEYLRPTGHKFDWIYHVVLSHGQVIHDPWFGGPSLMTDYIQEMYPGQEVMAVFPKKAVHYFYRRGKFSYK